MGKIVEISAAKTMTTPNENKNLANDRSGFSVQESGPAVSKPEDSVGQR